jgi:hypothetical protein
MDRAGLRAWVQLYERAWRTAGTKLLTDLFAPEATYQTAPFEEPFRGLPAIASMWRAGQGDEDFTMHRPFWPRGTQGGWREGPKPADP